MIRVDFCQQNTLDDIFAFENRHNFIRFNLYYRVSAVFAGGRDNTKQFYGRRGSRDDNVPFMFCSAKQVAGGRYASIPFRNEPGMQVGMLRMGSEKPEPRPIREYQAKRCQRSKRGEGNDSFLQEVGSSYGDFAHC